MTFYIVQVDEMRVLGTVSGPVNVEDLASRGQALVPVHEPIPPFKAEVYRKEDGSLAVRRKA